jgi:hypothetical protein
VRRAAASDSLSPTIAADPALARLLDQVTFYQEALDLLHRSELTKPAYRPPSLNAQTLVAESPPIARAFRAVADFYYKVRFGRRPLSDDELTAAHASLASLADLLRQRDAAALAVARTAPSVAP